MDRRAFLSLCASLSVSVPISARAFAGAARLGFEQHDIDLPSGTHIAQRCRLLIPRRLTGKERCPLLILCHGLGETRDERLGIRAWSELYGLSDAFEVLEKPPVTRMPAGKLYGSDEYLSSVNQRLKKSPLSGLVIACPFTPNPRRFAAPDSALDKYTDWLEHTLIPAVRERAPVLPSAQHTGIGGVSLGGYVAIEVFLRRPELFGTIGCVQAAINDKQAEYYSQRISRLLPKSPLREIFVLTSSSDPYRKANQRFSELLEERAVPHSFQVQPGPHNQAWLREIGCVELLLWHDRKLREGRATKTG